MNDMLLDDTFEAFWGDSGIPDALRIDHEDGPLGTNPETGGTGAHDKEVMVFNLFF